MIDILVQLAHGFVHCLTPLNMAMLVTGIVVGLLIGVLPGLTLVMGVALAGLVVLVGFTLAWLSVAFGLAAKRPDTASNMPCC